MTQRVVLDTSVVLPACVAGGLRFRGDWQWWAPSLVSSEVLSALHEAVWRGQLGFVVDPLELEELADRD